MLVPQCVCVCMCVIERVFFCIPFDSIFQMARPWGQTQTQQRPSMQNEIPPQKENIFCIKFYDFFMSDQQPRKQNRQRNSQNKKEDTIPKIKKENTKMQYSWWKILSEHIYEAIWGIFENYWNLKIFYLILLINE